MSPVKVQHHKGRLPVQGVSRIRHLLSRIGDKKVSRELREGNDIRTDIGMIHC
jgi:hypothetical protein